jgi:hypothetical protein
MSKVSLIYDAFEAKIAATFTGANEKKKVPDVLNLEGCTGLTLVNSYGIAFGPSQNTNRVLGCQMSEDRSFAIRFTRLVTTTVNNAESTEQIHKLMVEDMFLLKKAIETDPSLGNIAANARWLADGGIERLTTTDNSGSFLVISAEFAAEYFETLT